MFESPSLSGRRAAPSFELHSSSTPLMDSTLSPVMSKLMGPSNTTPGKYKSSGYKQLNHSKLKSQCSPYTLNHPVQSRNDDSPINYGLFATPNALLESSQDESATDASLKTNPPTTPLSSSITESSSSFNSSSISLTSLMKRQEIKSNSSSDVVVESALYVTPVTSESLSVASSSQQLVGSSALTTCSRSSSQTSLSSFDIKSTYSSMPSEYSSHGTNTQGFMTPACYSDLPDSPGDIGQLSNNTKRYNQEELSIITVDSNPKSNDITIIERTMIVGTGGSAENKKVLIRSGQYVKYNQSCSNGSSAYQSESNSFLLNSDSKCTGNVSSSVNTVIGVNSFGPNDTDNYNNDPECIEDDENPVTYDAEGSLCETRSTRSNVSSLTFPNEPTADLAFLRNLLSTKSSAVNTPIQPSNQCFRQEANLFNNMMPNSTSLCGQKPSWSSNSFTPPVKLLNDRPLIPVDQQAIENVNRMLFNHTQSIDWDADSCRSYSKNDMDDEDRQSIASVPSIIRNDLQNTSNVDKESFSQLLNKLSGSRNTSVFENTLVGTANYSSKANSPTEQCNSQHTVSLNNSQIVGKNCPLDQNSFVCDQSDEADEQQFLYEFIDECYGSKNSDSQADQVKTSLNLSESDDSSIDDFTEEILSSMASEGNQQPSYYVNPLKQESEIVASRILPKIEEEELDVDDDEVDECNVTRTIHRHGNTKPVSTSSASKSATKPTATSGPMNKIVWTKTAKLRMANKLKAQNESKANVNSRPVVHSTKRTAQASFNQVKENLNEKRAATGINVTSSTPTCSQVKSKPDHPTTKQPIWSKSVWHPSSSATPPVLSSVNCHSSHFNKK